MLRVEDRPKTDKARFEAADLVMAVTARAFDVPKARLLEKRRCEKSVAFARQAAMYLLHITFGLTFKETGEPFGRERTTVAYACALVEDERDDEAFDQKLETLEETLERLWAIRCLRARSARVTSSGRVAA